MSNIIEIFSAPNVSGKPESGKIIKILAGINGVFFPKISSIFSINAYLLFFACFAGCLISYLLPLLVVVYHFPSMGLH